MMRKKNIWGGSFDSASNSTMFFYSLSTHQLWTSAQMLCSTGVWIITCQYRYSVDMWWPSGLWFCPPLMYSQCSLLVCFKISTDLILTLTFTLQTYFKTERKEAAGIRMISNPSTLTLITSNHGWKNQVYLRHGIRPQGKGHHKQQCEVVLKR